jgi:hypothetical protein
VFVAESAWLKDGLFMRRSCLGLLIAKGKGDNPLRARYSAPQERGPHDRFGHDPHFKNVFYYYIFVVVYPQVIVVGLLPEPVFFFLETYVERTTACLAL